MKSLQQYISESISQKEFKKREKAVGNIESASDFYDLMREWKWNEKYPYLMYAVGYYIYGDKDSTMKEILSARGQEHLEDDSEPSAITLGYENSWYEYPEDLNNDIKSMKLKNGETVEENY